MHKWNVVIEGIEAEQDVQQVELKLASQLKLPEKVIAAIKKSSAVSVKRNTDHATAYRYKKQLEELGLSIRLERFRPIKKQPHDTQQRQTPIEPAVSPTEKEATPALSLASVTEPIVTPTTAMDERMQRIKDAQQTPKPDSSWSGFPLIKMSSLILCLAIGISYKLDLFDSPDMTLIGDSPEAQAGAKVHYEAAQLISSSVKIEDYLEKEKYQQLDEALLAVQQRMIDEPKYESAYFGAINRVIHASEEQLNRYVTQSGSAMAYGLRGKWYLAKGSEARGTCLARCVSAEEFETQKQMTLKGLPDLRKAIVLDPATFFVYTELVYAASVRGVQVSRRQNFELGIEQFPGSFTLRSIMMNYLRPRWGGSRSSMKSFYQDHADAVALNPRIYLLKGSVLGDIADTARDQKQCAVAVEYYDKALEYGLNALWVYHKANCLNTIVQNQQTHTVDSIKLLEEALAYAHLAFMLYKTDQHRYLEESIENHLSAIRKVVVISGLTQ